MGNNINLKQIIMRSLKQNVVAVVTMSGIVTILVLVFILISYYSSPARAEELYKEAVEVKAKTEAEALNMIAEAEKVRCQSEVDLATKKVKAFYDGDRPLEDGEDLQKLVSKTMQNCAASQAIVKPVVSKTETTEQGNFAKPDGIGIDAFLAKNGAEFVKEAGEIFRQVGQKHKVKPEVLVCIAQADSSLGRALKSTNNIGNVGNNDRGDVVHYASLEAGIEAMGKVLNNGYLGHYETIGQLSRGGGNKTGSIYASSGYNWNKNVKACLRTITGDPSINEGFKFRI